MGIRFESWRGAIGVMVIPILTACGRGADRPAAEDPSALVIPPLTSDANAPQAGPPAETSEARSRLSIAERDPRIAKRRPRSRALVLSEVQALERLVTLTSTTASDRAHLHRRLAESYNELAYTSSGADADRARDESIKHYVVLKVDHPQAPLMDEVLYDLGLAYELNGDPRSARQAYLELIAKHPTSKLVPLAYFAFGERFSEEAITDASKNELAAQAYGAVLGYPPADNPLYAYALLRLGETLERMNDHDAATQTFDRLRRDFRDSEAAGKIPNGP